MNKRGASHIDWAVSMGIFLVYILSMFIMIQPGIQPFYSEDNLFKVMEEQIGQTLNYEILRAPIYMNVTKGSFDSGHYAQTELIDFGLKPAKSDLKFVYQDPDGKEIEAPFTLKLDKDTTYILFNNPQGYNLHNKDNPHTFIVYYSKDQYSYTSLDDPKLTNPFASIIITPGTIEHLKGIDNQELQNFAKLNCDDPESYENLKKAWNFPIGKEFSLYYVEAEKIPYDMNNIAYLCNQVRPYDQSDVFVKEWSDWILNTNGTLTPIIFNLQIW